MDNKKISITLVCGFLGSGKTTFLNQYMSKILKDNKKIALIVNEFGDFDVDSRVLGKKTLSVSMLQGCICCDLQDDLVVQLQQLAKQGVTHVVIEATGIANPIEMLSVCQDPLITHLFERPTTITLVDSVRLLQQEVLSESTQALMYDQIRASQQVLLNKVDLLENQRQRDEVVRRVSELAPYSQIVLSTYGEVQEIVQQGSEVGHHQALSSRQPHVHYDTLSYHFTHPVSREQLIQFILKVPDQVLRMKGYIQFREQPNETYLLQYASGLPSLESVGDINLPTTVVIIGEHLDKPALKNKLELLQFG